MRAVLCHHRDVCGQGWHRRPGRDGPAYGPGALSGQVSGVRGQGLHCGCEPGVQVRWSESRPLTSGEPQVVDRSSQGVRAGVRYRGHVRLSAAERLGWRCTGL